MKPIVKKRMIGLIVFCAVAVATVIFSLQSKEAGLNALSFVAGGFAMLLWLMWMELVG